MGLVVVVLCSVFPHPPETFVVDHVRCLARNGWTVHVMARKVDWQLLERSEGLDGIRVSQSGSWKDSTLMQRAAGLVGAGVRLFRLAPSLLLNPAAWAAALQGARLRRRIAAIDPALVHAHFGPNGAAAALGWDGPLITNFHGYDVTSWTRRWGWQLYRRTLSRAVLVAHSNFVLDRLLKAGLPPPRKVVMGVDLELFRPPRRLSSWHAPLRLLSAGRLSPQKGHDVAIRALAALRAARPDLDARLRIVGAGPAEGELRALAQQLGVGDLVDGWHPVPYPELPRQFADSDVLIAASQSQPDGWQEAFCRVAIEGMACGLGVVATPCGGLPQTVGDAGIIAQDQGHHAVLAAILRLLYEGTPEQWGERARSRAMEFSQARMCADYHATSLGTIREAVA